MTRGRVVNGVKKLLRLPPLAMFHKVARLIPLRPLDAGRLCFLTFTGIPRVAPQMLRGRVSVREGTPGDVAALTALEGKRAVFESRFARGDRCVVAIADGRVVGYEWFSDRPVHHEAEWNYGIAVPPDAVYAYDAYIAPTHRNSGVWLRFKAHLAEWMAMHGKREVITFIDEGNVASWNTHVRFGFRPADTVLAIRVLGVHVFRVRAAADVHLGHRFDARARSL
jgi:L-amino acid N-acyltransferase YncA